MTTERTDYDPLFWEKQSADFDRAVFAKGYWGWGPRRITVLHWVLAHQHDHVNLLDVGCHRGGMIERLRASGYINEYLGTDIAPRYIQEASERLPAENFEVKDAMQLDYSAGTFDFVLANGLLMYLPEIGQACTDMFRIARKYVLLSTYAAFGSDYEQHAQGGRLERFVTLDSIRATAPAPWQLVRYVLFEPGPTSVYNHHICLFKRLSGGGGKIL